MLDETSIVGKAYDLAALISDRNVEIQLDWVMQLVNGWMQEHSLSLTLSKTEVVVLSKKHQGHSPDASRKPLSRAGAQHMLRTPTEYRSCPRSVFRLRTQSQKLCSFGTKTNREARLVVTQ